MGPRRLQQLDLFAPAESADTAVPTTSPHRRQEVGAARVAPELAAVASRLPRGIYLGTSSWSFPGWAGLVYDRPASAASLARHGLAAYAQHPVLRAVGIDRTYYAPLDVAIFSTYAAQVPAGFRFLVKAHEFCTLARFPNHERYGKRGGTHNQVFLDPDYAADVVVGPALDGLGDKAGPILFQFPPQDLAALGGAEAFVDRLYRFLAALPAGPLYAVEIRNHAVLSARYAAALVDAGVCHCFNAHPSMPELPAQAAVVAAGSAPAMVARWMLQRRFGYDEARAAYQPFDRIVDDDPDTRDALAVLCRDAVRAARPAFVIINNKAEGSAPLSAFALARRVADLLG
jgi:uncharacterized protein YecE (DUF72 family)